MSCKNIKFLIIFVLFGFTCVRVSSQNSNALVKSDSLFAKGVDLYRQQRFEEAIPLFKESDLIDKTELDSVSNRREYSAMWLASCYKMIGLEHLSDSIYKPFCYEPVDRRLTVVSDSLAGLATNAEDIKDKILYIKECEEIEANVLGEVHQFRANSLSNLILYQTLATDLEGTKRTFDEIYRISLLNKDLQIFNGLDFPLMYLLNRSVSQEEYFTYLDKIIYITSLSKNDSDNTLWRYYIKDKIKKLSLIGEYDLALKNAIEAYEEVTQTSVPNETLFEITSLLAYSYSLVQKILYANDSNKRKQIQNIRIELYDKMLHMAEVFWGRQSFNYGVTKYKVANLSLGMGEELNIENGKKLLLEAFEIITSPKNLTPNQSWDIIEIINSSVNIFDIANANDEFLLYAERIVNAYEFEATNNLSKLREAMARSLGYGNDEKRRKAIDIYSVLIENSDNNKDRRSYFKSRAGLYNRLKDYRQSLSDFLSVDSLYKLEMPNDFIEESSMIDNYLDIATSYFNILDTISCKRYTNLYCHESEDLIDRINCGKITTIEYPSIDDIKIELIQSYIKNISFSTLIDLINHTKAIQYTNLLLEFIDNTKPTLKTIQGYKRDVYYVMSNIYILQEDFTNAFAIINKLIESAKEDNEFNRYIAGLGQLASLYEIVSIEPELSLKYRLQVCELLSENLISHKEKMLKEQYITSLDMISHSWKKCADDYEYLGDAGSAEICHQQNLYYMERLEGKSSYYYANALHSYLSNYKIPYYHYKIRDITKAKMCLDTLATYYQINKPTLDPQYTNYDYCSIGRDYFYLEDSVKAKNYYDAFELELKNKNPENYKLTQEYLHLLNCTADLLEGKNRLNTLKEIENLCEDDRIKFAYEPIKSMTYSSVLHDIAVEYVFP